MGCGPSRNSAPAPYYYPVDANGRPMDKFGYPPVGSMAQSTMRGPQYNQNKGRRRRRGGRRYGAASAGGGDSGYSGGDSGCSGGDGGGGGGDGGGC